MAASFLNPEVQSVAIADRQKFEKELGEVLHKALNASDAPCKEKHVRSTIIATWRDKGCSTTWKLIKTFPLQTNNNVCWKACYLVHKVLREGHKQNIKSSAVHARYVNDLSKHWSHLGDFYSKMITTYLKLVWTKIAFHVKNPEVPNNLRFIETPFTIPTDIDHVFHFTVEVFDYQSAILHLYAAIMAGIDPIKPGSPGQLQMKVTPFVLGIQESASLYDLAFQLMKALHTSLPADTLQGHRDRFNRQYHALRKYFMEAKKITYVKKLVEVPILPPNPPNFLIGKYMEDINLSRQVVLAGEEPNFEDTSFISMASIASEASPSHSVTSQPEPTPVPSQQHANGVAKPAVEQTDQFDAMFGTNTFDQFFVPEEPKQDEKDLLIEQLMREIVELKSRIAELEAQLRTSFNHIQASKAKLEQKETELTDYKEIAEQACSENVRLKEALDASQTNKEGTEAHATARAKEAEKKFTQLREVYQKLRGDHIQLLRQSGETKKQLTTIEKSVSDGQAERKNLERKITSLTMQLEEAKEHASEEAAQLSLVKEQLKHTEMESMTLKESKSVLQEQLVKAEETGSHTLMVQAIQEAESIISRVKEEIKSPVMDGLTCTPAHLLSRTTASLDVIDNLTTAMSMYSNNPSTLGGALCSLSRLSHSMSEVMIQGAATANMASAEDGQKLTQSSCTVGDETLKLLQILKQEKLSSGQVFAAGNLLQKTIKLLTRQAEELIPDSPTHEVEQEPLGDAVEQEMANTARAIDEAAKRIEEMLRKSRTEQSGVNLEVNERILDSCTELMKAIQILMQRSKDLQREIVAEGMGTMLEPKEFYKKHSRWSEGLISAAKQVGFGASLLVESADKVVSGKGKFEQLIVSSKDIAASTAQLVAASKVKARPRSEKLKSLKVSSKSVSEATGQVVASAQTGSEMKSDASTMDYSKITLNQAKRLEMESQVRALELEKELEMERTHLTELRKIHYHLAGAAEGWDDEDS